MSDVIDVYIPDGPTPPRVQADFTTASGGDAVIWKIFNANSQVHQVEIMFEPNVHYFDPPKRNGLRKAVPPGTCAIFHGLAPIPPGPPETNFVRSDKYNITGMTSSGSPIKGVFLDPEIIVKVP